MTSIRTFIALDMPDDVLAVVKERQRALKKAGIVMKWVRPESIHLTLQFLGDIDKELIGAIQAGMDRSAKDFSPFSLSVKGLGAFPNLKRPRVLWMGLSGQMDRLRGLKNRISEELILLGFPPEKRPFKGHLTIGRIKGDIDTVQLLHAMSSQTDSGSPVFRVDSVCLYKSQLTPRGAVYTKLAEVSLGVVVP